jgi:hypothetical protein
MSEHVEYALVAVSTEVRVELALGVLVGLCFVFELPLDGLIEKNAKSPYP